MSKGYENENIMFFYVLVKKQRAEYIQIMYPVKV